MILKNSHSQNNFATFASFKTEEILPKVGLFEPRLDLPTKVGIISIYACSRKLEVFRRNNKCTNCGIIGNVFLLQTFKPKSRKCKDKQGLIDCARCLYKSYKNFIQYKIPKPFLRLYHLTSNNKFVLMTEDHIVPISKGGDNNINNIQTMCYFCNCKKNNKFSTGGMTSSVVLNLNAI